MLNSEYKLSESSVKPLQLAKSYQDPLSNHGIHCPILILVPSETLTAITSYLDPPSLSALAIVNIYLNGHVKDDNTWRRAFFYQFLGIGPENDLDDNKALLLRRPEGSWRNEFTVRYKLKRRWERSRNTVTTHIPSGSPISSMHVMPCHALLTSSIQYGTVARSLPLTGRILPGYLDASGGARVGNGNPNPELIPEISTCAISSDGGTAKIVWGTIVGDVLFVIAPRVMDSSRRDTSFRRCDLADRHNGSVLDIQWAANVPTAALAWAVVTASVDGRVKLWDAKSAVCQWTSQRIYSTVIPDACIKVAATQTAHGACIAAVMKSGEIHVWTGFALGSMATYEESSIRETIIECPISTFTQGYDSQETHAVTALHIDPNPTSASPTLLVAYEHDPFFYRIRVGSQTRTGSEKDLDVDITIFGEPFFGSTSIIVPYFWGTEEDQASFVFVGDHLGWVSLYAWDADNPSPNLTAATIQPVRKFEAHPDSVSITALTWSPHTLITGSARGTTHVFDALSFRHLRSFSPSPIPKTIGRHQAEDAEAERERRKVKQIIVGTGPGGPTFNLSSMEDRDIVFISVGERVMAWKAGPVPKHLHGGVRARHTHRALGKKKRVGYAKYLQQLEVNQTILESRHDHHQLLLEESRYNKSHTSNFSEYGREREREQRERLEHLGLSEVEAVEYVLMLSRDEANADTRAETGSGSSDISETHLEKEDQGIFEGDFDMEHNTDDDDDRPSFTHSTVSGRRSSTSSTSIPMAWPSPNSSVSSSSASLSSRSSHSNLTTVTRTIAKRRSIPRPIPFSNEKIQVSPSFKAEPMEAGEEWLVDYNTVGSGSISTSGDSNTSMGAEMEAHIFPPIRIAGKEVQDLQKDDKKVRKKDDSKGKKRNKTSRNTIEDTRKDMTQGGDKATRVEIPSPSPSSLASTSARNIPLSTAQNYGQRRTSNISNFSSPSTSTSTSTAPRNAWTSGGPSLSARISPSSIAATSSLHHHYQQQQQQGRGANLNSTMDIDEDLRLAIELSLIEARSRGEDV